MKSKSKKDPSPALTPAHVEESRLLAELCSKFGYMLFDVTRKTERLTSQFRMDHKTGEHTLIPARMFRLCVPKSSYLSTYAVVRDKPTRNSKKAKPRAKR